MIRDESIGGWLGDSGLPEFRPRFPWWGADLQTVRDAFRPVGSPSLSARPLQVDVGGGDRLLAYLDQPLEGPPLALVLLVHGLGGNSDRGGLLRLGHTLQAAGFAVLRLNLRGAGAGRPLARGSYAASCTRDLLPVVGVARRLCTELGTPPSPLPLYGVGLSLGGTVLLNACLDPAVSPPVLDRLVCVSSPLDLGASARQFERPRNSFYQGHLLRGLGRQLLADPFGVSEQERQALIGPKRARSIRSFDTAITAPRWGFDSADHYYAVASPLRRIRNGERLPPTLLLQSRDDPWVPAAATESLLESPPAALTVVLTDQGGHNGFHGREDGRDPGAIRGGCWSDRVVARWLSRC